MHIETRLLQRWVASIYYTNCGVRNPCGAQIAFYILDRIRRTPAGVRRGVRVFDESHFVGADKPLKALPPLLSLHVTM